MEPQAASSCWYVNGALESGWERRGEAPAAQDIGVGALGKTMMWEMHAVDSISNDECLAGDVQRDPAGKLDA